MKKILYWYINKRLINLCNVQDPSEYGSKTLFEAIIPFLNFLRNWVKGGYN